MKLNKKDLIWSVLLVALPAVALVAGMIPGIAVLTDPEDPAVEIYANLFMTEGWNNMGLSASLQLLLMGYVLVASAIYLYGQSTKVLQTVVIFACVAAVAGVLTMFTEQNLKLLPFVMIPVLCALEAAVAYIRLKLEQRDRGF